MNRDLISVRYSAPAFNYMSWSANSERKLWLPGQRHETSGGGAQNPGAGPMEGTAVGKPQPSARSSWAGRPVRELSRARAPRQERGRNDPANTANAEGTARNDKRNDPRHTGRQTDEKTPAGPTHGHEQKPVQSGVVMTASNTLKLATRTLEVADERSRGRRGQEGEG